MVTREIVSSFPASEDIYKNVIVTGLKELYKMLHIMKLKSMISIFGGKGAKYPEVVYTCFIDKSNDTSQGKKITYNA